MISFIIPAYNEEKLLPQTLEVLLEIQNELKQSSEIIVVDNNSDDRTAEIAKSMGVEVVFEAVNQISRARNAGGRAASGQFLIFIDADTLVHLAMIESAVNYLESGDVVGGGIKVELDDQAPESAHRYARLWSWVSYRFNLAAGCFLFCRKDAFDALGGFSEKVYASEEIWFSMNLKKIGRKSKQRFVIIAEHHVKTSSRKIQWHSSLTMGFWIMMYLCFPFLARYRIFCPLWYKRPAKLEK